jgi:hypothetical protein
MFFAHSQIETVIGEIPMLKRRNRMPALRRCGSALAIGCHLALLALLCIFLGPASCFATIIQLSSPTQLDNPVTTGFDGYPDYTVANTLFQNQGVSFTRDDGARIYLLNWTAMNRITTSPDNVLATVQNVHTDPTWATHLNVLTAEPVFAMGAYFGNDQANSDYTATRMSAYGLTGDLLGSVQVAANNNTHVDQFIGLRSDIPVARVRFDNLNSVGMQSANYSVVIDDLMFVAVPEPTSTVLFGIGALVMALSILGIEKRRATS